MRLLTRSIAAGLLAFAAGAVAAPATKWKVVDLGALGTRGSVALAINNRGDVGGHSAARAKDSALEMPHAFLWQNGAMRDLGEAAGAGFSQITTMNDKGTLAGPGPSGMTLWKDGVATSLGFTGKPEDINESDVIVGSHTTIGPARAFLYRDGLLHDLGTLGGTTSSANAINDFGLVVGGSQMPGDTAAHAFVYQNGKLKDIGTFGGPSSIARDVNNRGAVVGSAQDSTGKWHAFVYDSVVGMQRLFAGPGNTYATAINERGTIVGETDTHAYVHDRGVTRLLEELPEVKAAGWVSLFPTDINDLGWISGWGWKDDNKPDGSAFVLIPDETSPAPALLRREGAGEKR